MAREMISDLAAFLAVARERSFTRAAAQIGVSPSALSHTIRAFEERLGVRLLARTTRRVAPTEAGERLLMHAGPHVDAVHAELDALSAYRNKPAGSIRITCIDHIAKRLVWPKLAKLLADNPEIRLEICVDLALTDIVAQRFDAGIRLGEQVEKDMVAVRISPEISMAAVASPEYLASRGRPGSPYDLDGHQCINLRLPTYGGLYVWEFEKNGRPLNVRVDGQLVFNDPALIVQAAVDGFGIAFLPVDIVSAAVLGGRLVRVLEDWTPPFPGYHLYYPSRRQQSPAFALLVEALRYRG